MVDIHSHILYGIKDSPPNIKVSVEIAKQYVRRGFSHVISTPHFDPGKDSLEKFVSICSDRHAELKSHLEAEKLQLSVFPGAEVMICPELVEIEDAASLCIGGTSYMLVELPWDRYPRCTRSVLFWLGLQKITPILAHPERNREVCMLSNRYQELIDTEALLQLDISSFIGERQYRKAAESFMRDRAVSFFASDIHRPGDFEYFDKSFSWMERKFDHNRLLRIWGHSLEMVAGSQDLKEEGLPAK